MTAAPEAAPAPPEDMRFAFGANWLRFLDALDERAIEAAVRSLQAMARRDDLAGLDLLDIGAGSGLFSLAARRLGAKVRSFDFDPLSVACAQELKARFRPGDGDWIIEQGSVLDAGFMAGLGAFDVVYAWGSLHHTGEMWRALELAGERVRPGGMLCVSIYHDQGGASRRWAGVKRLYHRLPARVRPVLSALVAVKLWWKTILRDTARAGRPLASWRGYGAERGMSAWRDVVDWVGGWPFEVARPEAICDFFFARGFTLTGLKTSGGHGCNEFVFVRVPLPASLPGARASP